MAVTSSAPFAIVTVVPSAWPSRRFRPTRRATKAERGRRVISAGVPTWLDPSVLQHHQPVSERQRVDRVVGHEDDRPVIPTLLGPQQPADEGAAVLVEGGEGLVEEEDGGLGRQGAGDGRPLGLAAGDVPRTVTGLVADPELLQPTEGRRSGRLLRHSSAPRPEGHVVPQVEVREQRRVLEHEPGGPLVGRHEHVADRVVDHGVTDAQRAFVQRGEAGQDPQQRGLARPVLTQHPDDLARLHSEVELGGERPAGHAALEGDHDGPPTMRSRSSTRTVRDTASRTTDRARAASRSVWSAT